VIEGDNKRANWGLISANCIAYIFLGAGVFMTINGHDWAGGSTIVSAIGSLVATFIYGTNARKSEREGKMEKLLQKQSRSPEPPPEKAPENPSLPGL
jgi:hypothetical protein